MLTQRRRQSADCCGCRRHSSTRQASLALFVLTNSRERTVKAHHVGICIGESMMINALRAGVTIRTDPVDILPTMLATTVAPLTHA
ncbi:hypothetical protein [Streptosporangium sp. KLBMP 9127]|nr:hypothetical protein [Streptosporangium sp. KLBMP 9127]